MPLAIQDGQTIVFIGDSITDARRREDAGPLGAGYVKLFADLALIREPAKRLVVHNRGINGDRVNSGLAHIPQSGLTNRWQRDVVDLRPDWLSVMIGINDITSNLKPDVTPVTPEIYEAVYDDLLTQTRRALPACQLLLLGSFHLVSGTPETSPHREIAELLPKYLAAVERLSAKHGTRFVRTNEIFQRLIALRGTEAFGPEAIHPNATGHLVIAEAVYAALSDSRSESCL